ncbi:DUF4044 domain-containing protein [Weissella kandleri]|nr:DUF4044 domain-containing protein [Weissella kandleri]
MKKKEKSTMAKILQGFVYLMLFLSLASAFIVVLQVVYY